MVQQSPPPLQVRDRLLWGLGGAALGAVIMALATPKSGPELRRNLRRSLRTAALRLTGLEDPLGLNEDEQVEALFI